MKNQTLKAAKLLAILLFACIANIGTLNLAYAAKIDSSNTAVKDPSIKEPQVYAVAYLNLALTSQNYYAGCYSPNYTYPNTGQGTWYTQYVTCPSNSLQTTNFTFSQSDAFNCICYGRQNCATTNPAVTVSAYGNLGAIVRTITCFVPVPMYIPYSVIQRGTGNATLLGQSVYVNYYGTMPLIQPSSTRPQFAVTYSMTSGQFSGTDFNLMSKILKPSFLKTENIIFNGCGTRNAPYGYAYGGC